MKRISPVLLGVFVTFGGACVALAQDAPASSTPRILQITREYVKAGKSGLLHDKSESAFVQAMARAKSPTHYVALNSMSGKTRAIYLTQYDSFDAIEKDSKSVEKNAALSADLERASVSDGNLLDSMDQAVFLREEELSYHPRGDLSQARYLEITAYHLKPGHGREFREAVKMVQEAETKGETSAHWAMFSLLYGGDGDTFLVLSSKKALSEIDTGFSENPKFMSAIGEDGMKKLDELVQASIESSTHNLYSINPRQSYVDESWAKADPDFWKPKSKAAAETAAAKPAAPKPVPAAVGKSGTR
jgi:hypothetical protein